MSAKSEKTYVAKLPVQSSAGTATLEITARFLGNADEWHRAKILLDRLFKMKGSFQQFFSEVMNPRKSHNIVMAMRRWQESSQGAPPPHSQTEFDLHTEKLKKLKSDEFEQLLEDAGLPSLDIWPKDLSAYPFPVFESDSKLDEAFLRFLDKVVAPQLLSLLSSDIDQIVSIEFKPINDAPKETYHVKEVYKPKRRFPWLPILISGCVIWFIYQVWFSGDYNEEGQASANSSCRAQLENCLNTRPESQWENYCQPRYYRCLDKQ